MSGDFPYDMRIIMLCVHPHEILSEYIYTIKQPKKGSSMAGMLPNTNPYRSEILGSEPRSVKSFFQMFRSKCWCALISGG